jgi:hypothetical protein
LHQRAQIVRSSDAGPDVLALNPASPVVARNNEATWSDLRSGEKRGRRFLMASLIVLTTAGALLYCGFVLLISRSLVRSLVYSLFSR